ncbi:MAG: hypothetical protein INQ03_16560 [Candidatus Heimdallarchaeota archaeon]|nr:hypothetical protein [Candidatus Heimdallarchaeota archaeon]
MFTNGALLDIRYPVSSSYSFFLNYNEKIYRIDTAPHHKTISSYGSEYLNWQVAEC